MSKSVSHDGMQCTDVQGSTDPGYHFHMIQFHITLQLQLRYGSSVGGSAASIKCWKEIPTRQSLMQLSCLLEQSFPGTTWVTLYSTSPQTHSASLRCPGKVILALQLCVGVNNLCVSCLCLNVAVEALLFYKIMFTNSIIELYKQQDWLPYSQLECQDACRQIGLSVIDHSTHCAEMCFRINIPDLESQQSLTARHRLYALGNWFWH